MQEIFIRTQEEVDEALLCAKEDYTKKEISLNNDTLFLAKDYKFKIAKDKINKVIEELDLVSESTSDYSNHLIYGKNEMEGVVSVEVSGNDIVLFFSDGTINTIPNTYWFLSEKSIPNSQKLEGELHYSYINKFNDFNRFMKKRGTYKYQYNYDIYTVWDNVEAGMIYNGITLFKGLKVQDVSVLALDIETTGVIHTEDSRVLCIANSFQKNGNIVKQVFCVDHYRDDVDMIMAWTNWVQEKNPDIITGHNILGFDLPYLSFCYGERNRTSRNLELGRDCSELEYQKKASRFRVDGSQDWNYNNIKCFGRHIVDGMFLAVKFDFSRKYPSWKLKEIIQYEIAKLNKKKKGKLSDYERGEIIRQKNRTFYDAQNIRQDWNDVGKRAEIYKYNQDDADDSLYLYNLMISADFYYTQTIPMPFQNIINTATGKQINSFLIRGYLQDNHSIPKADESKNYGGGISFGKPGIYANCLKMDVSSLYPSIIIQYEVYDREKDPKGKFLEMVKYFTKERLQDKKKAKESGDRYYGDLQQSKKRHINSAYGLCGTPGLNFNCFENADFITAKGREILQTGVKWVCGAELVHVKRDQTKENSPMIWRLPEDCYGGKGFQLVNVDTDSFMYSPRKKLTDKEFSGQIEEVNALFPDGIVWEDDGYYKKVIVVKAKNYIMDTGKELLIKGSALKAPNKELALKEFGDNIINCLLNNRTDHLFFLYNKYAHEISNIVDISRWVFKKTVTKAILNSYKEEAGRKQERNVYDAIQSIDYQEGDKVKLFFYNPNILKLVNDFDGGYDAGILLGKLYKTLSIFSNVIDTQLFPNYSLKKNQGLLL